MVAQLVASGQLTQEQAGDLQQMLSLRLTKMLERFRADADRKRELRNARKKRRAKRAKAGLACCTVEHDDAMLEFLIATHWLDEADADDPGKVGEAVSAMWRQSAENN